MWIMTTDFSEHSPRQTRRVVRFTEPMLLTRSSPRADWRDAKRRSKTLFVVRHFVTLMAGTVRACSAVFETCRFDWRKMSDWSTRDHVIELLNSRWPPKLLEVFLSFGKCGLLAREETQK